MTELPESTASTPQAMPKPPADQPSVRDMMLPAPVERLVLGAMVGQAPQAMPSPAAPWSLTGQPAGGAALMQAQAGAAPPLRWATWDRNGRLTAVLQWGPLAIGSPGPPPSLLAAHVRYPGPSWLALVPGGARHPLWKTSDRLWFENSSGAAESVMLPAQPYARIEAIPPIDRPGALPPGAGSAVLNLLASLLVDQGAPSRHYRGPYPTPALFDALCGSFNPPEGIEAAGRRFSEHQVPLAFAGTMAVNPVPWTPRPWEAVCESDAVFVQWREGPQVVWLGSTPFRLCSSRRPMPAGCRLWREPGKDGDRYRAGLVLLGDPHSLYATFDSQGRVTELDERIMARVMPAHHTLPPAGPALAAALQAVVFAWTIANSATALAPAIADLEGPLSMAWTPLGAELARRSDDRMWVQSALLERYRMRTPPQPPREWAMMFLSDIFQAVAPPLMQLAQERLAARQPTPHPDELMDGGAAVQERARGRLASDLPVLIAELAAGRGLPEAAGTSPGG